jgi:hypothetical protein
MISLLLDGFVLKSPNTFGSFDMGDVYVADIKSSARRIR